jgi:PAS domain S-box-containing protein
LANKNFIFSFKRSQNFYFSQDNFSSWVGAVASLICLLIGTSIASLQFMKKEALELAEKKTQDLKESEKLLKFALEGVGDAVWDWDILQSTVNYAKNYTAMLGYSPNEFTNNLEEWKSRIHPDDFNHVMGELQSHFENRTNYVSEHRLKCKDGQYKWVLARGLVINRDAAGNPERMVGTISDITNWKEAEFEIEKQRSQLHSIVEGSSDALMLYGPKGFIDCNLRTLKLFGFEDKDAFISLHPAEISPLNQPDGSNSLAKANEQIKKTYALGVNQFEWCHQKRNGETFPAEVLLTAFTYDNERIIQACIRDISEKKEVEKALVSQREKLVAAAKMSSLGEMAGGIAHEINNPLAIIIGKTTQMKRRLKAEYPVTSLNEEIDIIENTAKRISAIINGLSAFSRNAENDKMDQVRVSLLIQDTLELSKERFRFNSVDLRLKLSENENTLILGKTSQLLQVLINLLNNAYDAVEHLPVRWVEIEVTKNQTMCVISVTDSGLGISSSILAKMMTPFFTTKEIGKGTGLGLSISKGIIEEHKGHFYYDRSSPHTKFVVELPLA